jgi:predicted nucleotide-binding protein
MKFRGSLDELKKIVEATRIAGEWVDSYGDKDKFQSADGAILNWWSKNGTLQFQGPEPAKSQLATAFQEKLDDPAEAKPGVVAARPAVARAQIFVVHGHDVVARDQLELVLRRLGLDPFVLVNTAGGGMTIIEALERKIGKEGESQFGIVLLTPDDVGFAKRDGDKEAKARARQNVILEMGMLLSSLTRAHVAILVKGFVELPSDAGGIIYLHFNDHVKEVVPKLCERLQASGIPLTAGQISQASS